LEYTKQNIQTSLNTKYVITVNALFLIELELLSRKCVILLKLQTKLLSCAKHFDTVQNFDRRTVIVEAVPNSWRDLWSRVWLTVHYQKNKIRLQQYWKTPTEGGRHVVNLTHK